MMLPKPEGIPAITSAMSNTTVVAVLVYAPRSQAIPTINAMSIATPPTICDQI